MININKYRCRFCNDILEDIYRGCNCSYSNNHFLWDKEKRKMKGGKK